MRAIVIALLNLALFTQVHAQTTDPPSQATSAPSRLPTTDPTKAPTPYPTRYISGSQDAVVRMSVGLRSTTENLKISDDYCKGSGIRGKYESSFSDVFAVAGDFSDSVTNDLVTVETKGCEYYVYSGEEYAMQVDYEARGDDAKILNKVRNRFANGKLVSTYDSEIQLIFDELYVDTQTTGRTNVTYTSVDSEPDSDDGIEFNKKMNSPYLYLGLVVTLIGIFSFFWVQYSDIEGDEAEFVGKSTGTGGGDDLR